MGLKFNPTTTDDGEAEEKVLKQGKKKILMKSGSRVVQEGAIDR